MAGPAWYTKGGLDPPWQAAECWGENNGQGKGAQRSDADTRWCLAQESDWRHADRHRTAESAWPPDMGYGSWHDDGKGKGKGSTGLPWSAKGAWPGMEHGGWHGDGEGGSWHGDGEGKGKGKGSTGPPWSEEGSWAPGMDLGASDADWDPKADEWLRKLNAEMTGRGPGHYVTMADFNRSLEAVVQSHKGLPYAAKAASRFPSLEVHPRTSWKAGCFCPTCPTSTEEDDRGQRTSNEIGLRSVDWAYHLAAVLRLMPLAACRKNYMLEKGLMDDNAACTVFFNGMAANMSMAFQHLLGALDPPVQLDLSYKVEQGQMNGKHGPLESASYRMIVASVQEPYDNTQRSTRLAIMQLVMAFHQRLADWPGPHSHTKCYPWVIGRRCKLGMQHNALIGIELALAAWKHRVEDILPRLGKSVLDCSLGPLEGPGPGISDSDLSARRLAIKQQLQNALPEMEAVIERWAGS